MESMKLRRAQSSKIWTKTKKRCMRCGKNFSQASCHHLRKLWQLTWHRAWQRAWQRSFWSVRRLQVKLVGNSTLTITSKVNRVTIISRNCARSPLKRIVKSRERTCSTGIKPPFNLNRTWENKPRHSSLPRTISTTRVRYLMKSGMRSELVLLGYRVQAAPPSHTQLRALRQLNILSVCQLLGMDALRGLQALLI